MKDFDWQVNEENDQTFLLDEPVSRHGRNRWFWLTTLLILTLMVGGWGLTRYQVRRAQMALQTRVQAVLDLEQSALRRGDGDLFFSIQADDPAWFAAQLHPEAQARVNANRRVTHAQEVDQAIWANITWQEGDAIYQQVLFLQTIDGRLLHSPTAPDYWGRNFRMETSWGRLDYSEVDGVWADEMAAFIRQVIAETCPPACQASHLPLTVVLTPDYVDTAVPNRIHMPSPRLLALDGDGRPADIFWQELRRRLQNAWTPATIRFAVPPDLNQLADYESAARDFMAVNPHITVEIITLDTPNPDPASLLAYDGAAFPLTEALLASGGIVDLTGYARSDPDFDQGDFYEQIWQGAWWHGRMWFVPHTATMSLLYYDKAAYREAEYPEPSLRWTWEELHQDMLIVSNPYSEKRPSWGFLDPGNDTLFSYAYHWNNNCTEAATVACSRPLDEQAVSAALTWYQQMAGQPGLMPDRSEIPERERQNLLLNWQSARRRAVIWVDTPLNYEYRLLLAPLGVVSFPGSNRFDGITPLRVQGHFISQQANNSRAVWEWLKFLSFQTPTPTFRQVPARPSVAESSQFWQILPRELGNPMRIAFPFARPVTLAEQRYFTEEQIMAVLTGAATPAEAPFIVPELRWFSHNTN